MIERLAPAILLHDCREGVLDALICGESLLARLALAPPSDDVACAACARIDHLVLGVPAKKGTSSKVLPRHSHRQRSSREMMSVAFVPPNPKEFDITWVSRRSRARVRDEVERTLGIRVIVDVHRRRDAAVADRERAERGLNAAPLHRGDVPHDGFQSSSPRASSRGRGRRRPSRARASPRDRLAASRFRAAFHVVDVARSIHARIPERRLRIARCAPSPSGAGFVR